MKIKSRLFIYTFLAVFLSILAVGTLVMPLVFNQIQDAYYRIQSEVNERQAQAMTRFLQARLATGADPQEVLQEFQSAIEGSDTDRGYICLIDQGSSNYLCHPDLAKVGRSAVEKNPLFDDDFDGEDLVEWIGPVSSGESGAGLLHFESVNMREVVHFQAVDATNWTVSSHENSMRLEEELASIRTLVALGALVFAFLLAFPVSFAVRRVSGRYEHTIELEQERADGLLENILPQKIVPRMKAGESPLVEHFQNSTVLFCDIVDFTPLSRRISPEELVELLNKVFSCFDEICNEHGVEKIKTIGDAYMAVCGVPDPTADHALKIARVATRMLESLGEISPDIQVRIGINSGEVVAGVIGTNKFIYDLWGETVNLASRLETTGSPGRIHCGEAFLKLTEEKYRFESCGETEIKGHGTINSWFLLGEKT